MRETVVRNEKKIEAVEKRVDDLAAQIAREKCVPAAALRAVLVKLGELGVDAADIPKRLEAAADQLVKLRTENDVLRKGPPQIAAIAAEAQTSIDKGDFDAARAALTRGREAARKLREGASLTEAQLLAQEARVDHLQLAYRSAAAKYGEAASIVASFDEKSRNEWLLAQAGELYHQGDEFGDNAALGEAIDGYRRLLELAPRERVPLDWARAQNNLGIALWRLGERESGTGKLDEAVAAYGEAPKELTRERVPLQWATGTRSQGVALMRLAERKKDLAMAQRALGQIEAAFEVMRDGGHATNAALYEARLPYARALVERLRGAEPGQARPKGAAAEKGKRKK